MSTFEQHFTEESLDNTFERLLDSHFDVIRDIPRIAIGSDRIDLPLFLEDKAKHLAAASRKVLEGRYTFSPFLERAIPKEGSEEMRTISIASIRDSVVQRALYNYLYDAVDTQLSDQVVFGYRKRKSAHDAIAKIQQHFSKCRTYVFEADLEKFFDRVDHDVLLGKIDALAIDPRAKALIRRFLKTGKIPKEQVEEHRVVKGNKKKYQPEKRNIGVPQGGVLSGLLSNLYLADFDRTMQEQHIGLVRYADDFLVCCSSATECSESHQLAIQLLQPLRVNLHPDPRKTKLCVEASSGVEFLGFKVFPTTIRVRGRNIAKFKTRILGVLEKTKPRRTNERTLRHLCNRLSFKIRGPKDEQLQKLAERGQATASCRRSWIGFFRIVDDLEQIRQLDRWVRSTVSKYMWQRYKYRVSLKDMQEAGLPSLVNCLWKARKKKPIVEEDQ